MTNAHPSHSSTTRPHARTWALTISGLLLVAQAVFLAGLAPTLIGREVVRQSGRAWGAGGGPLSLRLVREPDLALLVTYRGAQALVGQGIASALVYLPLAPAGLVIGLTLLAMRRYSWAFAMLLQAVVLGLALFLYVTVRPPYVYLVMLSGVVLVGYLNYEDVRLTFTAGEEEAAILTAEEGANGL